MVDLNPYGRKGCSCFLADDYSDWMPNAGCRFHGLLADYQPPRQDTGVYRLDFTEETERSLADHNRSMTPEEAAKINEIINDPDRPKRKLPPRESAPLDGPECPPGVHSMFDFCPGGCLSDDEPEYDPRDGCGYLEEGRDCPNDHGPAPKQPCDYDGMYGPHRHADEDICVVDEVTTTYKETGVRAAAQRWFRRLGDWLDPHAPVAREARRLSAEQRADLDGRQPGDQGR